MESKVLIGIDYGSRLAGTTALAILKPEAEVIVYHTKKGQDADQYILDCIRQLQTSCLVAIDAPLSLPGVYQGLPGCSDYFYRAADKDLKAMSPMFLGGLTARAMQLSVALQAEECDIYEVYPSALPLVIPEIKEIRKNSPTDSIPFFTELFGASIHFMGDSNSTKHAVDALCALMIATRLDKGIHYTAGLPQEGLIHY